MSCISWILVLEVISPSNVKGSHFPVAFVISVEIKACFLLIYWISGHLLPFSASQLNFKTTVAPRVKTFALLQGKTLRGPDKASCCCNKLLTVRSWWRSSHWWCAGTSSTAPRPRAPPAAPARWGRPSRGRPAARSLQRSGAVTCNAQPRTWSRAHCRPPAAPQPSWTCRGLLAMTSSGVKKEPPDIRDQLKL